MSENPLMEEIEVGQDTLLYFKHNGGQKYIKVIEEILQTEVSYLIDIKEIINSYLKDFKSSKWEDISNQIFGNIEEMFVFNCNLLSLLKSNLKNNDKFCNVFVEKSDKFIDIYGSYCTNYVTAIMKLEDCMKDQEVKEFVDGIMTRLNHKLPLSAYLLKPVQRLLKYHLLLKSLADSFDKASIPSETCVKSQKLMEATANKINTMKKDMEDMNRFYYFKKRATNLLNFEYVNSGKYIKEFTMMYGVQPVTLILFERYIVIDIDQKESDTAMAVIPIRSTIVSHEPKKPKHITIEGDSQIYYLKVNKEKLGEDFQKMFEESRQIILNKLKDKEYKCLQEFSLPTIELKRWESPDSDDKSEASIKVEKKNHINSESVSGEPDPGRINSVKDDSSIDITIKKLSEDEKTTNMKDSIRQKPHTFGEKTKPKYKGTLHKASKKTDIGILSKVDIKVNLVQQQDDITTYSIPNNSDKFILIHTINHKEIIFPYQQHIFNKRESLDIKKQRIELRGDIMKIQKQLVSQGLNLNVKNMSPNTDQPAKNDEINNNNDIKSSPKIDSVSSCICVTNVDSDNQKDKESSISIETLNISNLDFSSKKSFDSSLIGRRKKTGITLDKLSDSKTSLKPALNLSPTAFTEELKVRLRSTVHIIPNTEQPQNPQIAKDLPTETPSNFEHKEDKKQHHFEPRPSFSIKELIGRQNDRVKNETSNNQPTEIKIDNTKGLKQEAKNITVNAKPDIVTVIKPNMPTSLPPLPKRRHQSMKSSQGIQGNPLLKEEKSDVTNNRRGDNEEAKNRVCSTNYSTNTSAMEIGNKNITASDDFEKQPQDNKERKEALTPENNKSTTTIHLKHKDSFEDRVQCGDIIIEIETIKRVETPPKEVKKNIFNHSEQKKQDFNQTDPHPQTTQKRVKPPVPAKKYGLTSKEKPLQM